VEAEWYRRRYFKLPPYTILGFQQNDVFVNENIDYTRSDHAVLGVEYILGPASSISIEGFLKQYEDYPVSVSDSVSLANKGADFEVLGNEAVESIGLGRSYGLEFLFQQKLTRNFYGILSYTYFYSEFTGFDSNNYLPSVWDSRHLVSFTGGYKLKKNWEISSRLRYAGSTPAVPTDLDATLANYPSIILDYERIGEEQLGTFNQLDFRVDKKWNFKKLSLNVFLDIQNILGSTSPQSTDYILARDEQGNVIDPNRLVAVDPSEGSSIPSIGIVVDF
jgi:outer membrane receptor protein involved in Fe transport